jgi:hypothetical protein
VQDVVVAKGGVDLLIPGDVGVKENRLATGILDHLNGLEALVILDVQC